MSVQPIRIIGDPVLHKVAKPVAYPSPSVDEIVNELFETMRAAPGVGLAAPQIGIPLQIFVWEWTDGSGKCFSGSVINPSLQIISRVGVGRGKNHDFEGCLSVPDLRFNLGRAKQVKLLGINPLGEPLEIEAHGWLARIFQHEYDHLRGIIYLDRLRLRDKFSAKKITKAKGWGKSGNFWVPGVDPFELRQ